MTHALTCPVCTAPMAESSREGVTIDTCTRCRGVWLDRGELDKLRALWSDGNNIPPRHAIRHDDGYNRHDDRDDHGHSHSRSHKRSRMDSIFDIFD